MGNPFAGTRRRKFFDIEVICCFQLTKWNVCIWGKEYENDNDCLLKILKALIDQKSDWYLDEVAEMEQRAGRWCLVMKA